MARKRTINPDIWQSVKFAGLSNLGKLVFIGMFSQADDYGRVKADALWVKMAILPAGSESPDQIEGALTEIFEAGNEEDRLAKPYKDRGSRLAYLPSFEKEQVIGRKFPPKYTAPPLQYTPALSDKEKNALKNKTLEHGALPVSDQSITDTEQTPREEGANHTGMGTGLGLVSDLVLDSGTSSSSANADAVTRIADAYTSKIQPGARVTDNARKKIKARLKSYTEQELIAAMDIFARDSWRMENNANEGIAWWFNSDDRIDKWLNLKPKGRAAADPAASPYEPDPGAFNRCDCECGCDAETRDGPYCAECGPHTEPPFTCARLEQEVVDGKA